MSRFASLEEFGGSWSEVSRESLTAADIKLISKIEVVERKAKDGSGDTFLCMCFFMKSGKQRSEYLSKMSDLEAGDEVDPKSVEFIELERDGETCWKADGEVK